ncbi:MAG: hypothetical protein HFH28_11455 [Clostridiaceae bacterium]|nr:hypothetical protein [Clostridiaceae bacterium]
MGKLTDYVVQYMGDIKAEYENRYHIQILMWVVRKSFLKGLERSTSDLDVVFIFQSLDSRKKNIIFERADRRVELQCWDIQDILDIMAENKRRALLGREFQPYYKSNELQHYILDYYNGFYIGWESAYMQEDYGFRQRCGRHIWKLYEPLAAARLLYLDMNGQIQRAETGYLLSLNEYINAIWSGLAGIHILSGGKPSDVHVKTLAEQYLPSEDAKLLLALSQHFKQTVQKQSNYCNLPELNRIMKELQEYLEQKMKSYQPQEQNIEKELMGIQKELKEMRNLYEDEGC